MDYIIEALKKYFKFESFKSKLQEDAVRAICKGNFILITHAE